MGRRPENVPPGRGAWADGRPQGWQRIATVGALLALLADLPDDAPIPGGLWARVRHAAAADPQAPSVEVEIRS